MIILGIFLWALWVLLILAVVVAGWVWIDDFWGWGDSTKLTPRICGTAIRLIAAAAVLSIVIGVPPEMGWV
ncbi:membrane protein [Arthrobacter phage Mufasa8]|uniref:Membrane protein n=1 Tax=Arthrobacter phage Mufasa8 TaxID=2656526 RepID=A0A649VNC5_9CAUD|nr:membrane protein [Arthrobacter phage Mufasa8]QGJ93529.1 membrane protein [Arthrobacter phage Mufasa8]